MSPWTLRICQQFRSARSFATLWEPFLYRHSIVEFRSTWGKGTRECRTTRESRRASFFIERDATRRRPKSRRRQLDKKKVNTDTRRNTMSRKAIVKGVESRCTCQRSLGRFLECFDTRISLRRRAETLFWKRCTIERRIICSNSVSPRCELETTDRLFYTSCFFVFF